ncbi:MAG: hypothetical protein U5R06_23200 [candidate division KSB1 bacterium]|nr:hypothetical protein [candidate division KSB1 bacterium]
MANQDAMTIFINHRVYDYDHKYISAAGLGLTVSAVTEIFATLIINLAICRVITAFILPKLIDL